VSPGRPLVGAAAHQFSGKENEMNFRERDRVSVTGTVKGSVGNGVLIEIDGADPTVVINVDVYKVTLDRHHFEIGDGVYSDDSETVGVVMAVNDNWLWIQPSNGRAPCSIEARYCHHDEQVAS
jgi:hypothetical protein